MRSEEKLDREIGFVFEHTEEPQIDYFIGLGLERYKYRDNRRGKIEKIEGRLKLMLELIDREQTISE